MWQERTREKRRMEGEKVLEMVRPPDQFAYPAEELDLAWRIWRMSDFAGVPPTREQIQSCNLDWVNEVLRWCRGVIYEADKYERPENLR